MTPDGATDRRQFFRSSGAVLGALTGLAALTGAVGRRLGSRFSAAESRADVVLPPPVQPLAPLPATVQTGVPEMTPFITPNADFYRIDTALVGAAGPDRHLPAARSSGWWTASSSSPTPTSSPAR